MLKITEKNYRKLKDNKEGTNEKKRKEQAGSKYGRASEGMEWKGEKNVV